jgi:hypothetical protein
MFTANALTVAFSRAVRKAKISDFHLHDLRHSFATELRKRGNGLDVIAKLLGHSDLRMTQRYAHLGDEILEQATQSIQGVFTQEALNNLAGKLHLIFEHSGTRVPRGIPRADRFSFQD